VQLPNEGYVQAVGIEALDLITANSMIVYSDEDGDGIQETFTLTTATSITDPLQIAVYFSATERWDDTPVAAQWRIQPVRVSIAAGVATITGSRWLCVKPALYVGALNVKRIDSDGLLLTTASNFATTFDIYRRYTNGDGTTTQTSQAVLTWEAVPYPGWWFWGCCGGTGDPASIATAAARVGVRNAEQGIVFPGEATYDSTTQTWNGAPCLALPRCLQSRIRVRP
jgi:hypothetical protein